MKVSRLCELVESVLNSEVGAAEWVEDGLGVRVVLQPYVDVDDTITIVSTMFGQLHIYDKLGAAPYVRLGDKVDIGQRLALLEVMKTFCPVVSTRAGRIVEVLVEHGAEVAAGQPLFRVA